MRNIKYILLLFISIMTFVSGNSQTLRDSIFSKDKTIEYSHRVLKGLVLDANNQSPLPYANIFILNKNKGVVSNEKGSFSVNISDYNETDTLRISYIGYIAIDKSIKELKVQSVINLKEDHLLLNNITLLGSKLAPKTIIEKVIENKSINYQETSSKKQVFIRKRDISNVNKINFDYKKSNSTSLNKELIEVLEKEIPKHTISYKDFLGDIYQLKVEKDSIDLKVNPIQIIELEEKTSLTKFGELKDTFKEIFSSTKKNEYWKIKTGLIGGKVNINENSISIGGTTENTDSLNTESIDPYRDQKWTINDLASYSSFEDEDQWEFLYSTNKYQYTLYGVTIANEEEVYIIDFKPTNKGLYTGRLYVAMNTYALIRADYEYFSGRIGRDIQLYGIGYTENKFKTSLYFEKSDNHYKLKYCSRIKGLDYSFDRTVSFLKKKERFLFDQKLEQIKVEINVSVSSESSIEILILEENKINNEVFNKVKQDENSNIIYVDQFDEELWKDYSIIEPTKQMKNYKKLN